MPRSLHFHAALADIRASNRPAAPVYFQGGSYDRAAIMREAVRVARSLRAGGATWQWRMAIALRTVWGRARTARDASANLAAASSPAPALTPRSRLAGRARVRTYDLGVRLYTHSW